jgi:site-specific DNA-cytosine methylase/intein/homing endonuclease
MLKVIDTFTGAGGFTLAGEEVGFETVAMCECDKYCHKVLKHWWDDVDIYEDMYKLQASQLEQYNADMLVGGSSCFIAGTLINTYHGYKPIEDIEVGDMVLTHLNRYREVLDTISNSVTELIKIKASGTEEITTTPEHPFYCYTGNEFKWIKASNLTKCDYLVIPINDKSYNFKWHGVTKTINQFKSEQVNTIDTSNSKFWWFVGRYLADGWRSKHKRKNRKNSYLYKVELCCGKHEEGEIEQVVDGYMSYYKAECPTVIRYTFCSQELYEFLGIFGDGALNKEIPPSVLDLPHNLLESLVDGYFSGDGCVVDRDNGKQVRQMTTISAGLTYSLAKAIHKLYGIHPYVTKSTRPKTTVIEGRIVNQHDTYLLRYPLYKKGLKSFIVDGYLVTPVKNIEFIYDTPTKVYNMEVMADNSYCVNNIAVHNCQSLSGLNAKGKGLDGSSKVFFEFLRIRDELKPKYWLLENVGSMTADNRDKISKLLGVKEICIDSSVLSAQVRNRYYWCNWPVEQPKDAGITFNNIYAPNASDTLFLDTRKSELEQITSTLRANSPKLEDIPVGEVGAWSRSTRYPEGKPKYVESRIRINGKANTITTGAHGATISSKNIVNDNGRFRLLSEIECERLQQFPDGHTSMVSSSQRYKMMGNAVTVNVIKHIYNELIRHIGR